MGESVFIFDSAHAGFPENREWLLKKVVARRNRYAGYCLGWIMIILPAIACQYWLSWGSLNTVTNSFWPLLIPGVVGLVWVLWDNHRRYRLYESGQVVPGNLIHFHDRQSSLSGQFAVVDYSFISPSGKEIIGHRWARDLSSHGSTPAGVERKVNVLWLSDRHYLML